MPRRPDGARGHVLVWRRRLQAWRWPVVERLEVLADDPNGISESPLRVVRTALADQFARLPGSLRHDQSGPRMRGDRLESTTSSSQRAWLRRPAMGAEWYGSTELTPSTKAPLRSHEGAGRRGPPRGRGALPRFTSCRRARSPTSRSSASRRAKRPRATGPSPAPPITAASAVSNSASSTTAAMDRSSGARLRVAPPLRSAACRPDGLASESHFGRSGRHTAPRHGGPARALGVS
jgi:hypothetical protein